MDAAAQVSGALVTVVDLFIQCTNLKNMDVVGKSDPMVLVYTQDPTSKAWLEVGRTERVKNDLNPKFTKAVRVNYYFEIVQRMRFVCLDIDDHSQRLDNADIEGTMECALAEVVTSSNFVRPLVSEKNAKKENGRIQITAQEFKDMQTDITMEFSARHLDKKDLFGKSDPFLVFNQVRPGHEPIPFHKTEVIKHTLDPYWKPFTLPASQMCGGDPARQIKIDCYDWDRGDKSELIGSCFVTLGQLTAGPAEFPLSHPSLAKKKGDKYKGSGTLRLMKVIVTKNFTFMDYVRGGCEICLITAIDFTASNGNPQLTTSLHYNNPCQMNEYESSIRAVGDILNYYDTDKMIPVYGFGAKLPPVGTLSHCFALNGNPSNPEVAGVDGIVDSYKRALCSVTLYGPTFFSEIIKAARFIANSGLSPNKQRYCILLIITDGVINDVEQTIDEIVEAGDAPLSIVIVGVGNTDFSMMNVLDGDEKPLTHTKTGRTAPRDIVQFVPFSRFKSLPIYQLARETLAEIPTQLVQYMKSRNITPLTPPHPKP